MVLVSILVLFYTNIFSQTKSGHIKVYFNHPVNTLVSTGTNAVYLNNKIADTLVSYINKAKYTIDIAIYNFSTGTTMTPVITALNNAYLNRGVVVRYINNGSSNNYAAASLNAGIKRLSSPTSSNYGIMHDKFMIVDANSATASDAFVWTGSTNWDTEQFNSDVNNVIVIYDKPLAQAYTAEFNEMWGSTTSTPNATNAKFGPDKTDPLSTHTFTIDGKTVELYFSPTDGVNNHILTVINSANSQLFFGVYTFTETNDANAIVAKNNGGVYCAGIMDQYSNTYTPYTTLSTALGNNFKEYIQSNSIYHNKFVIVDPCNTSSDPTVLTGSHNWTSSADTKNDENTLIIHDATIANIYYQSFYQNFSDLGGTLTACPSGIHDNFQSNYDFLVFPNPANNVITIKNVQDFSFDFTVYDMTGKNVLVQHVNANSEINQLVNNLEDGIYMIIAKSNKNVSSQKLFIQH